MHDYTLDAGPLIQLDHQDRKVLLLLGRIRDNKRAIKIPATVLAQVIRNPTRQVRLARLIRQPGTVVVPLDQSDARSVGVILALSGTSDIADAHVVVCARRSESRIVTSDPNDIRRLDPSAAITAV